MKGKRKLLIGVLVAAIIVVVVVLGLLTGHKKSKNTTTASVSTATVGKPITTVNKPNPAARKINLSAILANLQKQYPTVQQTYIYSQSRDPNGVLGKPGFYTAGAEFYDTRTGSAPSDKAFGNDSGGAIEVYQSAGNAAYRVKYLQQFQGNGALDPGAFKQVGNVVVRASSQYTAVEQQQVADYLAAQVQAQQS